MNDKLDVGYRPRKSKCNEDNESIEEIADGATPDSNIVELKINSKNGKNGKSK